MVHIVNKLPTELCVLCLLVIAEVRRYNGHNSVERLPHNEHGFAILGTKHAANAVEISLLCSFHNPLVACGVFPLFHPLLPPHLHLGRGRGEGGGGRGRGEGEGARGEEEI